MASRQDLLARYEWQANFYRPNKWGHNLTAEQAGGSAQSVLYTEGAELDRGAYGSVRLESAESVSGDVPPIRAVKIIDKQKTMENKLNWRHEIVNLILLSSKESNHPDLFVKLFGWYEKGNYLYLAMEYLQEGDLFRCRHAILGEADVQPIARQVAQGLMTMHQMGIVHRDLKPRNILVAQMGPHWRVKIGDFGFSKPIDQSISGSLTARGTTKYSAPEIIDFLGTRQTAEYTTAMDMWSFGCVIYELFVKACPFEDLRSLENYTNTRDFPKAALGAVGASAISVKLIQTLLKVVPTDRATAEEALNSEWLGMVTAESPNVPPHPNSAQRVGSNPALSQVSPEPSHLSPAASSSLAPKPAIPPRPASALSSPSAIKDSQSDRNGSTDLPRPTTPGAGTKRPKAPVKEPVSSSGPSERSAERPTASSENRKDSQADLPAQACLVLRPFGRSIEMSFENLTFESVRQLLCDYCKNRPLFGNGPTKPTTWYNCKTCDETGCRALCERCIPQLFTDPMDPHEADHKVHEWIKALEFSLPKFLDSEAAPKIRAEGVLSPQYGEQWLKNDHSFIPPTEGYLDARCILRGEPGEYSLAVQIRTSTIQDHVGRRSLFVKRRTARLGARLGVRLGSIIVGAEVINNADIAKQAGQPPQLRYLPRGAVEHEVKLAENEVEVYDIKHLVDFDGDQVVKKGFIVKSDQSIVVHIRSSYDFSFFQKGSPFKWWLESIKMTEMGPEEYKANKGQLEMRKRAKVAQEKERLRGKRQDMLNYGTQGAALIAQLSGMKASSSSAQLKGAMSIAAIGSSFLKAREGANAAPSASASASQQRPTVNNFFLSDEAIAQLQREQEQEQHLQPEHEGTGSVDPLPEGDEQQYFTDAAHGHPFGQFAEQEPTAAWEELQARMQAEQAEALFSSLSMEDRRNLGQHYGFWD